MGKAKRMKPSKITNKVPLEQDIQNEMFAKSKNRNKIRLRQDKEEQFVNSNLSRKILSAARKQQREIELDVGSSKSTHNEVKIAKLDVDDDSDSEKEETDVLDQNIYYENIVIDEEDEKALEMFMSKNPKPRRTLADIVEKIAEKQTELETHFSDAGTMQMEDLTPQEIHLYETMKDALRQYRSGKLPKAFKSIPNYKNWEQVLHITDPPSWSAAAMYQATRIFVSNLKENVVPIFLKLVLLPRIRDDLAEYKRLNFHLYEALRKSLFKPGGFMKGILLPLLESGDCTLREAIIIGSIVARNSIPILHSSTAILTIVEMDYTGANSIFLRILLDKKYALPYRVVDACVCHFVRFENDSRELPVLWHQSLLTFVQRYKDSITKQQQDKLLELLNKQYHHSISPEIRRELENAKCIDQKNALSSMDVDK